jgi:hypothetical protein
MLDLTLPYWKIQKPLHEIEARHVMLDETGID